MWLLRESAHPVLTDGGGAILDERTGRWTYLTATASAAVMLLLAGSSREEAARQYAQRYGIPAERAATDIRTVADALTAQGLAVAEQAKPRCWWGWWR